MYMSFRWFGKEDPVSLQYIRQIPKMKSIVSSLHDEAPGSVWDYEKIKSYKENIESYGLSFRVIESVPVHEDIKLGQGDRDKYIENYIATLKNLSKAGLEVITYNFMPVFDWTRTRLDVERSDKSTSSIYRDEDVRNVNPRDLAGSSLPAWVNYTKEELASLLEKYESVDENRLWENLEYFLKAIIPVAKEHNLKMAIHPDDPPWSVYGLPRLMTCKANFQKLLSLVDEKENGICFCTGCLGVSKDNDVLDMAKTFSDMGRIHFVHARNVSIDGNKDFSEVEHTNDVGNVDFAKVLKIFSDAKYSGPIRPDHGRMIWGEKGLVGYGLYDRALGAVYLQGIWDAFNSK